jgi:putative phage-type endonuclease
MHTIHNLVQGTPEWLAHREKFCNASEAPVVLGMSPYVSRSEFIRQLATGDRPEPTAEQQDRFDAGHRFEAIARPWAEEIIGEDLYPVCASHVMEGVPLASSYDGVTMDEETLFEHKSLNIELAAALKAGVIPDLYKPQMEQQMMVIGAKRCLFMASNGNRDTMLHQWYESEPEWRAKIIPAWRLLLEDVKNFQPVETPAAAAAAPITNLPALSVEISGRVVASNIDAWRAVVAARIDGINTNLVDDQSFADAAKMVTFLEDGEKRIDVVKAQAQAQAADIDAVFRAMDEIKALMRAKRLELDKLVEKKKADIRSEILKGGQDALTKHLATANAELGHAYMPVIAADFAGAMKGKRTVASLREAVSNELARAKIAANQTANRIRANMATLKEFGAEHTHLFPDTFQIILKAPEDFTSLVKLRVAEHQQKEAQRLEADRERIRKEEADKLVTAQAAAPAQATPTHPDLALTPAATTAPKAGAVPQATSSPYLKVAAGGVRPTDDAILLLLSSSYRVSEQKVIGWLLEMDLQELSERRQPAYQD